MDENPPRAKRAAIPRGHAKLGPITPAFISADDVARHVHERIGSRRDVEFASVILRRVSDGLYVGSEPLQGKATSFDWNLLLDRERADGEFIEPDGYQIVASLHSHPDTLTSTQQLNPKWTLPQVKAFISFFSPPDMIFNHQDRARFAFAYLSGPDGALLKYQPSGSAAEAGYIQWLRISGPWTSPDAHDGTLEGLFKKLAQVGTLTFLSSSPSWGGSTGEVPDDWQPYAAFTAAALPVPCGPVFVDLASALSQAWQYLQRKPTARQHVLLLKHDTRALYAASYAQTNGVNADQLALLPAGFHLHGVYVHSRPLPGQYPELEAWLYKNFISPQELASQIAQFRQYSGGPQSTLGASLFIRLRDEAILRYRFSGSAAESRLFARANNGDVGDNGTQMALQGGRLLPRDFVRHVAEAGELSVEKTSALWDRAGLVGDSWRPYANHAMPGLSRAFLSADDAARYACERIRRRGDGGLAGLLLKRSDGRFVVTDPQPVGPRLFKGAGVYPLDRQDQPIVLHPGHQWHGAYCSYPSPVLPEPAEVARRKWAREDVEVNACMLTRRDVADLLLAGRVGYLCSGGASVIAYEPGDSPPGWLQAWLGEGPGSVASALADGTLKPVDGVRKLAEHGRLRVVIGNQFWGPAGRVELDWAPYVRVLQFLRPEPVSHGAVFDSADAAAQDRHSRDLYSLGHAGAYFGFILKHQGKDEFVASELIPVTQASALLSLTSLYGATLPVNFACHGLYYARPWARNGIMAWLDRFFIVPADLSEAVTQARLNAPGPLQSAVIYIAPFERALLRYQSPSTRGLFESAGEGDDAATVEAKLGIGSLEPLQFLRNVASAGTLRVIESSPCWDRIGEVDALWKPYRHLQRRRLSPAFLTLDDAARHVRRQVPQTRQRPYGGIILRRDDGLYLATEPLPVQDEVFDIKAIFPDELVTRGLYPTRTSVVACYHSRPARAPDFMLSAEQASVYANMFSTRALAHAMGAEHQAFQHYLLCADGALLRLHAHARVKYPLIRAADVVMNPRHRDDWRDGALERALRNAELTPTEYVNRVADSFTLQVVVGSLLWGGQGRVAGWRAFAVPTRTGGSYPVARYDPACSPLFTGADDAMQALREQVSAGEDLQFGYVLKSAHNGHFIATLPVTDDGSRLAHRRVFSDAGYPYRYGLAGIYFCVPHLADFLPAGPQRAGDEVYKGLFSPTDLLAAIEQVHATAKREVLAVYIFCADAALLKFVVHVPRFVGYSDALKLRLRLLSPRTFIRSMAAAGDLRILRAGSQWPGEGVVDTQWQPGRSRGVPAVDARRPALGPVHGHPEDAVGWSHERVGRFVGQPYLSALLEYPVSNAWVAALPLPDTGYPSPVAGRLFVTAQYPANYRICAAHVFFHAGEDQPQAPAQDDFRRYFVSWRELEFYLHGLKRQGLAGISGFYLSTRDGALLRYMPSFSVEEYNVLGLTGKWSAESGYTRFAPEPSWFIAELARIGELSVLRAGTFWAAVGVLGVDLNRSAEPVGFLPPRDEL